MQTVITNLSKHLSKTVLFDSRLFIIWRGLFALYFIYYALRMIPYSSEIYGSGGIVPESMLNWTYGVFPNILYLFNGSLAPLLLHGVIIVIASMFALGYAPRIAALVLWYAQTALFNRNVLTDDPSMAYVGLLLIMVALIPNQPKAFSWKEGNSVVIPYFVFMVPLTIFCVTFTVSGFDKFMSTSWWNGSAFAQMLTLQIARDNFLVHTLLKLPMLTTTLSYMALIVQTSAFLFFVLGKYRIALYANFLSFCLVFFLFDLNQVVYGMLLFFLFFIIPDVPRFKEYYKHVLGRWLPIRR